MSGISGTSREAADQGFALRVQSWAWPTFSQARPGVTRSSGCYTALALIPCLGRACGGRCNGWDTSPRWDTGCRHCSHLSSSLPTDLPEESCRLHWLFAGGYDRDTLTEPRRLRRSDQGRNPRNWSCDVSTCSQAKPTVDTLPDARERAPGQTPGARKWARTSPTTSSVAHYGHARQAPWSTMGTTFEPFGQT